MQRGVVIVAVILLVMASLGVGALTAHWPFWRRAWAWHEAGGSWPVALPGPHAVVRGGAPPLHGQAAAAELATVAASAHTHVLLRSRAGGLEAWSAAGFDAHTRVDGHGLTLLLLAPLFENLARRHDGLLERPVGAWFERWRQDYRGALTPRELLAQLQDGVSQRPAFPALNPFSPGARLASGPRFRQAAMSVFHPAAPSVPDMLPAAAAQLLAGVAAAVEGAGFAEVLERELWSALAAHDATLLLDNRRGTAAAHCCMQAAASDWLRLGLRLAAGADAHASARSWSSAGIKLLVSPVGPSALLWVGEGDPPSGLETLLASP